MTTNAAPNEGERHKFPKKHLVTGERILWEGRPSIVVYFLRSLLLFVFGGLFGVMAILQSNQEVDLANLGTFLALLAMLLLVVLMVGVHRKWGLLSGLISVAIIVLVVLNVHVNGLVYFIPMIIGLLAFAIEYLIWSHTFFAISDRRIMTQYGIFNIMFADTQIDRVQNLTVLFGSACSPPLPSGSHSAVGAELRARHPAAFIAWYCRKMSFQSSLPSST